MPNKKTPVASKSKNMLAFYQAGCIGLAILGLLLVGMLFNQVRTLERGVSWLFVQTAKQAVVTKSADGAFTLTLSGVSPVTHSFSDRPDRRTGVIPTMAFLNLWKTKTFIADPPNATLTGLPQPLNSQAPKDSLMVELRNPQYDSQMGKLTYDVKPLEGSQIEEGTFQEVSVFIDSAVDVLTNNQLAQTLSDLKNALNGFQ